MSIKYLYFGLLSRKRETGSTLLSAANKVYVHTSVQRLTIQSVHVARLQLPYYYTAFLMFELRYLHLQM